MSAESDETVECTVSDGCTVSHGTEPDPDLVEACVGVE